MPKRLLRPEDRKEPITARVKLKDIKRLDHLAFRLSKKRSSIINDAIVQYLDAKEWWKTETTETKETENDHSA
jgi:predicted transcriptional regulator